MKRMPMSAIAYQYTMHTIFYTIQNRMLHTCIFCCIYRYTDKTIYYICNNVQYSAKAHCTYTIPYNAIDLTFHFSAKSEPEVIMKCDRFLQSLYN